MVLAPPWGMLSGRERPPTATNPYAARNDPRPPPIMVHDAATHTRPPLLRLGVAMLGSCLLGAVVAGWMASLRGGSVSLGALTLAATIPGVAVSLLLIAPRPAQPLHAWAMPVLAGGLVRAFVCLGVALAVVETTQVDKPVFLLTVLGVLLACLAIEVGSVLNMVHARGAAQAAPLEGARS